MTERWVDIPGYENEYMISDLGRVMSKGRYVPAGNHERYIKKKILTAGNNACGYKKIVLCKNNIGKNKYIHRLVAESFLENVHNYPCVNHLNYDRSDNRAENLEWVTAQDNVQYSAAHMRKPNRTSKLPASTNQKYIRYRERQGKKYSLEIRQLGYYKSYQTLDEAMQAREMIMRENEYFAKR